MKERKITQKVTMDLSKHYNSETGELMESELGPGASVTVSKQTGLVTISYENYAVIDSGALLALTQLINNSDLANVLKMAIVTKTTSNIVYNGNVPHTNETLQKYLKLSSEAMYMKMIRRLMLAGILYQIKGLIYGEVRVCYILNPYLSRKRKTFEEQLTHIFSEFKTLNDEVKKDNTPDIFSGKMITNNNTPQL